MRLSHLVAVASCIAACSGSDSTGNYLPPNPPGDGGGDAAGNGDVGSGDYAPGDFAGGLPACTAATAVYFSNLASTEIWRMDPDGANPERIIIGRHADELAIDPARGKLYWTEDSTSIGRANLDGSGVETVLPALTGPYGLALDRVGGFIYWTNQVGDPKVERATLAGTGIESIVPGSGCCAIGITVDEVNRMIYWMDGYYAGPVSRAQLDGTGVEVIGTTVGIANGIDVNPSGGKIYWTEYGNSANDDVVRHADLDGSNWQALLGVANGLQTPQHIAVDPAAGKFYFTDIHAELVQRANLDGSGLETLWSGPGQPRGIALLRNQPCQ